MKVIVRSQSLLFLVGCILLDLPIVKRGEASRDGTQESPLNLNLPPRKPVASEALRSPRIERWKNGPAASA